MSTTTENKKTVTANWQSNKIQSEVLKSTATLYASLETILSKTSPEIASEVNKALLINKGYYADLPIKAPIDLVNSIAEYTTNVLGIKVAVVQENNKASVIFEGGTLSGKLAVINKVPADQAEKQLEYFKNGIADLGALFGFKTEIATVQPDFIVTFSN
jgi:hypothetical protein